MSGELGEFEVALGDHVFDPADAAPLRRARGDRRGPDEPDPNDTRLIQFVRVLSGPDLDRLKADYGLALTAYLPNLAYVERVDAATRRRLSRDPLVRAVAPYRPEYKIAAPVAERIAADGLADAPVVASLFSGGSIPLVTEALDAAGATDIVASDNRDLGGLARVMFTADDPSVVTRASQLPDVRFLELAGRIVHDDVPAASLIQSGATDNASVWARGLHGEGQIIGQLEGGTPDLAHCFFADAAPNTPGPGHRKVVDLRNASITAHATFAAGCAVGDERNNSGANAHRGSAWAARLASGSVQITPGSMLTELTNNMTAGAFVHTNSWHDDNGNPGAAAAYNGIAIDVDTFLYNNEEHIVFGSSGNVGEEQGPPGTAKNAVCVSAANTDGTAVDDGNPGPTADGRRKPDVVAAGCSIVGATGSACATRDWGCATSWATPHAAGTAALVRQYFTEGWLAAGRKDPANALVPSGALMRAMIVNSTVNMTGVPQYPNATEGWGLIRLDRALMFDDNGRNLVARDIRNRFGLQTGEEFTQAYTVTAGTTAQQLKVVMAYTDPPGTAGAANTLVNNLDLEVTDPNGVKYVGNDFEPTIGFSHPNSALAGDSFNTIEVVVVAAPAAGTWTVKVKATSVTVGRQGFALAMTSTAPPPVPSSWCFVASAVYADPWHPDVAALRGWRGAMLDAGGWRALAMRRMVAVYAVVGPPAGRVVTRSPRLRRRLRTSVFPRLARRLGGASRRPGPDRSAAAVPGEGPWA